MLVCPYRRSSVPHPSHVEALLEDDDVGERFFCDKVSKHFINEFPKIIGGNKNFAAARPPGPAPITTTFLMMH